MGGGREREGRRTGRRLGQLRGIERTWHCTLPIHVSLLQQTERELSAQSERASEQRGRSVHGRERTVKLLWNGQESYHPPRASGAGRAPGAMVLCSKSTVTIWKIRRWKGGKFSRK